MLPNSKLRALHVWICNEKYHPKKQGAYQKRKIQLSKDVQNLKNHSMVLKKFRG